jgi:UDP-N-acetylglucosamine--N-acetylmuramyl-(pentapeptide) pyrophosphoryl-undecaprenol N-acetylglucosamine transferase
MKHVLIAAGGTGGHISPGVALAEVLVEKKKELGIDSVYIHSLTRNKDNSDLKEVPCKVIWHTTPQFSKNPFLFPFSFLINFIITCIEFKKVKIDVIIAMGGYSSLPSILFAILFRKKLFLCEQNRIIGKVLRNFLKFADKIAFSFEPINFDSTKNSHYKILGNPIRKKILPDIKDISNKLQITTKKEKIKVLVMGGSQGARQINNMVLSLMNHSDISKNYQFRVLTGSNLYEETKAKSNDSKAELISYSEDMKSHYEWANLVIARSGAGVISECSIFALPQILIPYPFAADNHQSANAKYFEEKAGAWLIEQRDEDNTKLTKILLEILQNREILVQRANLSLGSSKPSASLDTIKYFFENER